MASSFASASQGAKRRGRATARALAEANMVTGAGICVVVFVVAAVVAVVVVVRGLAWHVEESFEEAKPDRTRLASGRRRQARFERHDNEQRSASPLFWVA